jgi:phosphoribosylformimino-5-aminoimidazole carboxamide ribotide isomerase
MQLLPAIDLRHGKVVRLTQGDAGRATVYGDDPLAVLRSFAAAGVRTAHVVDLDAALGEAPQRDLVTRMASLPEGERPALQLGGGLRDGDSIRAALDAGAARAVVGSLVARDPDAFAALAGALPGRLVPALDVRHGEVRVSGWTEGAELAPDTLAALLAELPCPAVLVTDVERDGTMEGPNIPLTRRIGEITGLPALVSGGVRSLGDLAAAYRSPGIGGAVVGRALYEGRFTLAQALAVSGGAELPLPGPLPEEAP